jgi:hypothetical protein
MTIMHVWGDGFKYFREVDEAAFEIGQYCRKWGRISVTQTKEKYGISCVYLSFGWYQLFSITHPGYIYSRYPSWLWKLDCRVFSRIIPKLNFIVIPYQKFIYRRAYHKAFRKYPLIKEEIISGADYPEIVSPYFEAVAICHSHSEEYKQGTILWSDKDCEICKIEERANEKED